MTVKVAVNLVAVGVLACVAGAGLMTASWLFDGITHDLMQIIGGVMLVGGTVFLVSFNYLEASTVTCRYCQRTVPHSQAEPLAAGKWACERCLSTQSFPQRAA